MKTNLKARKVGLTLDHPLQVELELDLLAGVDDEGELEDDGEEEAQPCQRPKRPHQNFTFNPSNAVQTSDNLTFITDQVSQKINRTPSRRLMN